VLESKGQRGRLAADGQVKAGSPGPRCRHIAPFPNTMFRLSAHRALRPAAARLPFARTYTTPAGTHALVLIEHRNGALDSGSLSALTAAQALGGEVTGLVVGGEEDVKTAVDQAKT
jgi:hypothetical protein